MSLSHYRYVRSHICVIFYKGQSPESATLVKQYKGQRPESGSRVAKLPLLHHDHVFVVIVHHTIRREQHVLQIF